MAGKKYFDGEEIDVLMRSEIAHDKEWRSKNSHNTDPAKEIYGGDWNPHPFHEGSDERCIFGAAKNAHAFEYSDRLWEWDAKKAKASWSASKREGEPDLTANRVSRYLSAYLGKPVTCTCIISGCNRSNGYSYRVFGYVDAEKHATDIQG